MKHIRILSCGTASKASVLPASACVIDRCIVDIDWTNCTSYDGCDHDWRGCCYVWDGCGFDTVG